MNRGVDHGPVFFADADRIEFGRQLAVIHEELDVAVLSYCLMGNHFHLLLRTPPNTLSSAMHRLLSIYTRHTNDRVGRDGPLFRGRFHSIPVETDAYLLLAARYIHRNPLDLPGIASPRDYRWSSHRTYLGLRAAPDFLDTSLITSLVGGPDAIATFTEDDRPDLGRPPSIDDMIQLVQCAIALDDLSHTSDDVARQRLARTVLVLLADRTPDPLLRAEIIRELGHPTRSAADRARRRANQRARDEPMVRRILSWVELQLAGQTGSGTLRPTDEDHTAPRHRTECA